MQIPSAQVNLIVQFDEIDSFQIVHHSKLVVYLERARIQLLHSLGFSLIHPPYAAVIYAMKLDFKKPARLLEELRISSEIERVEGFKMVLAERVRRGSTLIMKATTEIVFLELADSQPVTIESVFPNLSEVYLCH